MEITDAEFGLMKEYLLQSWGIDIPGEKRYLFHTRLADFLVQEKCNSFGEFYRLLQVPENDALRKRLIEAMTTNETAFFRDGHPFEILEKTLLPALGERRKREAVYLPPKVRIWSAGCSTGQEPYTIAMLLHAWQEKQEKFTPGNIAIIATDISQRVLCRAREGLYREQEIGKWFPQHYRRRYLQAGEEGLRISREICDMIHFSEVNLAEPFEHLGRFDLILCRNVIIYFSMKKKLEILQQFRRMLNPGGMLLLGASETLYGLSEEFLPVHIGQTIYYSVPSA